MKKILILAALVLAPLSAASAQDGYNPVEEFVNAVSRGKPLADKDFQPALDAETKEKLAALKGCKRASGKVVDGNLELRWKCRGSEDGEFEVTTISMVGDKISGVALTQVRNDDLIDRKPGS